MKLHFVVIACLVLPGCARYTPRASTPIKFYLRQVNDELSSGSWLAKYNSMPSATAADQALKAAERNRLLNEFVWIIDNSYGRFETSFYSGKATEDIAGDFLELGLTGAAALSAAERVKTVLAMVATTTAGGKTSIDSHWFDAQSRYAVVTQMNALRAGQLTIIEQGMKQNLQAYTLGAGYP